MRIFLALTMVLAVAACDGVDPAGDGTEAETERTDTARLVSYSERLLFLAGNSQTPRAAVFDFAATVDSAAVQRTSRIWSAVGEEWRPLLDTAWSAEPMRDPWRLVPHGPLRLTVDRDGELDTVLYRAEDGPVRLRLHDSLTEWSAGSDAQLRLRRAELAGADAPQPGVLMDLRLGYERRSGADRVPGHVEAFLTDERGAFIVMLDDPDAQRRHLWMSRGGQDNRWDGGRLRVSAFTATPAADADSAAPAPSADTAAPSADTAVPDAASGADGADGAPAEWNVAVPESSIQGELQRIAATPGASASAGLFIVRGWLQIEGERMPVYGVVRHGRE